LGVLRMKCIRDEGMSKTIYFFFSLFLRRKKKSLKLF